MAPAERAATEEEDRKNRGPRMSVELSFKNIVHKFTHKDYFAMHQILQNGRPNWLYLQSLWDLQVLLYNLFTCAQGHGNPCNYLLGVPPPTVAEYLFSANNNLLVPIITNMKMTILQMRMMMTKHYTIICYLEIIKVI